MGQDDEAVLGFAYQLLRQVLLGEQAIEEVANAREERVESREGVWEARRQTEVGRRIAKGDQRYRDGGDPNCGYN